MTRGRQPTMHGASLQQTLKPLCQPGVNPADVEKVLPNYVKKFRAGSKNIHHYKLQSLGDVHFDMKYGARISRGILWILALIGFFLIFTACLNFINLATAQALNRSREVGVRKTLGGVPAQLFWQFTLETAVTVVLATMLAFSVTYSVLPNVNAAVVFLTVGYQALKSALMNPVRALRTE